MKQSVKVLKAARDLIAGPYLWMKGVYQGVARDKKGHPIPLKGSGFDEFATCYCAAGAVHAAANSYGVKSATAFRALRNALRDQGNNVDDGLEQSVINFNDAKGTSKRDVLDLFDDAIEAETSR